MIDASPFCKTRANGERRLSPPDYLDNEYRLGVTVVTQFASPAIDAQSIG
jgi:hypothetical protein